MTPVRFAPLILLVASCSPAPAPFTDTDREAVVAEARAASMALVDALNEHDAAAILSFYDLDDDFTQVACTDYVFGAKGFVAITTSLHSKYRDAVYEMVVRSVRALGPDAAVVSLQGTMLAPLFVTRVLQRSDDGRWLVVWEHESWPGCPGPALPHPGMSAGDSAAVVAEPEIP